MAGGPAPDREPPERGVCKALVLRRRREVEEERAVKEMQIRVRELVLRSREDDRKLGVVVLNDDARRHLDRDGRQEVPQLGPSFRGG